MARSSISRVTVTFRSTLLVNAMLETVFSSFLSKVIFGSGFTTAALRVLEIAVIYHGSQLGNVCYNQ